MRPDPRSFLAVLKCADLFCGAGGFSEGFRQAGFRVSIAVDSWAQATTTHQRNHPDTEVLREDILDLDPDRIGPVDLLIGGPPCQEFSLAKRGGTGDPRIGLRYLYRFLRFVYELEPRWWVMENVPRVLTFLPPEVKLRDIGIDKRGSIEIPVRAVLMAADHGAPQRRLRLFSGNFPLPKRTHADRPRSQRWEAIGDAERTVGERLRSPSAAGDGGAGESPGREVPSGGNAGGRAPSHEAPNGRRPWVTLGDVIGSFPSPLSRPSGDRAIRDPLYGFELPLSRLTQHFYDGLLLTDEEARDLQRAKRDHSWYGRMPFPEELHRPVRTITSAQFRRAREAIVLAASSGRYRRMSVREASTLQGFPITYQWWGASEGIDHYLIGNAVCPQVASAIGRAIARAAGATVPRAPQVAMIVSDPAPDPVRVPRPRAFAITRRFRDHVPGSRTGGFRVDVINRTAPDAERRRGSARPGDAPLPMNPGWLVSGRRVRHLVGWEALLCRGSGARLRRDPVTIGSAVEHLARAATDARSRGRALALAAALARELPAIVPDASTLQAVRAEKLTGAPSPAAVLEQVASIVDRYYAVPVDTSKARRRSTALAPGSSQPLRVAAALVGAAFACEIANTGIEWLRSHRSVAYRPARAKATRTTNTGLYELEGEVRAAITRTQHPRRAA